MSTQYPGNPAATQAPSLPPSPFATPTVVLPADGEAVNAAAFAQAYKVSADFIGYGRSGRPTRKQELYELADVSIAATQNPVTNYQSLVATIGAATTIAIQGAGVGSPKYAGRSALFTPAVGANAWLTSSSKLVPFAASLATLTAVIEFDVMFSAFNAAQTYALGFSTALNGFQTDSLVFTQNNGVWQITQYVASAPVGTTLAAGFNPVANTFQRMRLSYFGSATPQGIAGGHATTITATVNDVLAATYNPVTDPSANMYVITGGGLGAVSTMTAGTWTMEWNRY